ncbi:hypothetical protein FRB93_011755 [Tulasnella sp. JGI-2019a]|nr:hypothetical protein FRB93_011755 [Tulasnella sp. JGI-2019a]
MPQLLIEETKKALAPRLKSRSMNKDNRLSPIYPDRCSPDAPLFLSLKSSCLAFEANQVGAAICLISPVIQSVMATREIFYARSKRHRTDYATPYHPTSTGSNVHDIHPQTLPPPSHPSSFGNPMYARPHLPPLSDYQSFMGRQTSNISPSFDIRFASGYPSISSSFDGNLASKWSTTTPYPESSDRTRMSIEPSTRYRLESYDLPSFPPPKIEAQPQPVIVELSPHGAPQTQPGSDDEQFARKPRQQRRETLRDIKHLVFTFRVGSPDGDEGGRQSTAAKARRFARFSNPTLDPPMVCKFQAIVAKDDREGLEDSTTELEPFVPEESLSPTFPYQTLKDDDAPKTRDGVRWLVDPSEFISQSKSRSCGTELTGPSPSRPDRIRSMIKSDPVIFEVYQPSTWTSNLTSPTAPLSDTTSNSWTISPSVACHTTNNTYAFDNSYPTTNSLPCISAYPEEVFNNTYPLYNHSQASSSHYVLPSIAPSDQWSTGTTPRSINSRFGGLHPPDTLLSKHLSQVLESSIIGPPPRDHVCSICNKGFERPSSLRTHMTVHSGEKPHHCTVPTCTRRFSVLSNLRRHLRKHGINPRTGLYFNSTSSSPTGATSQRRTSRRAALASTRGVGVNVAVDLDSDVSHDDEGDSSDYTGTRIESPTNRYGRHGIATTSSRVRNPTPQWVPESLKMLLNAATLTSKPPFDMTWCSSSVSVPLRPVRPSGSPSSDHVYEERNSYDPYIPEEPYHPTQWVYRPTLPGPGLV